MKKLATLATIAIVALGASPVSAGDLEYALAFERDVLSLAEKARASDKKDLVQDRYLYRLESRLYADRDGLLNTAALIKVDMCKSAMSRDQYLHQAAYKNLLSYSNRPNTIANKLDRGADLHMLIILSQIPCDPK